MLMAGSPLGISYYLLSILEKVDGNYCYVTGVGLRDAYSSYYILTISKPQISITIRRSTEHAEPASVF